MNATVGMKIAKTKAIARLNDNNNETSKNRMMNAILTIRIIAKIWDASVNIPALSKYS
jgi:hypothetical protein